MPASRGSSSLGKESAYSTGAAGDAVLIPGSGKSPWRRAWQPTPVFLPGESQGLRSLAGCSPQGHKGLDVTEATEHAQLRRNVRCWLTSSLQKWIPLFSDTTEQTCSMVKIKFCVLI